MYVLHKVSTYKEHHSVCPLPPERGAHSPAGEGLGESQFRQLEKKLSTLPTLWCTGTVQCKLFVPTRKYAQEEDTDSVPSKEGGRRT